MARGRIAYGSVGLAALFLACLLFVGERRPLPHAAHAEAQAARPAPPAGAPAKGAILQVVYDAAAGVVSIAAHDVTLGAVLEELGRVTRLRIAARDRSVLTETISADIHDIPLERAINWLVKDFDTVFVYSSAVEPRLETAPKVLSSVTVLSRKAASSPLAGRQGPASVASHGPRAAATDAKTPSLRGHSDLSADLVRAVKDRNAAQIAAILAEVKRPGREADRHSVIGGVMDEVVAGMRNFEPHGDLLAVLKELDPSSAVAFLTDLLAEPDARLRRLAVNGFGLLKDERAIAPLLSALTNPVSGAHRAAADNLVWVGGERAADALANVYRFSGPRTQRLIEAAVLSHGDAAARQMLANMRAAGVVTSGRSVRDEPPAKKDN